MVTLEQLDPYIVPLGAIALVIVVVTVAIAALKHAVVRQLESKNQELKEVLETNTQNIAQKTKTLRELESRYNEIQGSLSSLSERNNELKKDYKNLEEFHEKLTNNYDSIQKNYIQSLQTISQNKEEFDAQLSSVEAAHSETMKQLKHEAKLEIENHGANFKAEFEHLKKSHKRLAQANQTLSKTLDNAREEKDFYRSELEAVKNGERQKRRIQPSVNE